jgi:hypothetical protein
MAARGIDDEHLPVEIEEHIEGRVTGGQFAMVIIS